MDPTIEINEFVEVATGFYAGGKAVPHKLRYHSQDITLTTLGLRHPTRQGTRMVHVFDVSDGCNDYRLEFDAERLTWRLISMVPGEAS